MNGTLAAAVARLHARETLSDTQAVFLARVARGELISVRRELQVALWAGVSMVAAGAGLLVKEQLGRLGPLAIAVGLGLAAALCIWHVSRSAPPFSWGRVPSPTLAFDYVLLLGVLLLGSELAYVEARFSLLGPQWPWHLLVLALIQFAFAFRHDSRAVLSLALASFAAWRGVALSFPAGAPIAGHEGAIRANALAVGALFLAVGFVLARNCRKAHFEPVFGNIGLALVLGASVAGAFAGRGSDAFWLPALLVIAAATIALGFRTRRSDYFAQGVVAALLGLLRLAAKLRFETGFFAVVAIGSLAALLLILWAHRRFKEQP